MLGEEIEELGVQERFASENPEEGIPVSLGVIHDIVEIVEINFDLWFVDVDPASLTAEIAAVEDGDVDERGEVDSLFEALFEKVHRAHALVSKVPHELGKMLFVSRGKGASCKLETGDNHLNKWGVRRIR
jgi:hypothetical protein